MTISPSLRKKLDAALDHIRSLRGPVVVAFSGGVDSSLAARIALEALGSGRVLCVAARSESNTDEDITLCRAIAQEHGMPLEVLEYSELAIPNYAGNPANRCYFCKSELYGRLEVLARERGAEAILDGSNADDAGDYRPGLRAVREKGVRSPLREAGIGKAEVRELARHFGLPNHDKPSSPCLSSRIPYGEEITREKLDQVAAAEAYLRSLGLREFRCRHHGGVARLEVLPGDFPHVLEHREEILARLRDLGFVWVSLDLAGFRSGSLNAVLSRGAAGTQPTPNNGPG